MDNVLIIGANSDIGQACIKEWSSKYKINTISRNTIQNSSINTNSLISNYDMDSIDELIAPFVSKIVNLKIVLVCYGTHTSNNDFLHSRAYLEETLQINLESKLYLINVLNKICNGTNIGIINSVAGDIPRGSNFAYGMHKSCISFYLKGLNLHQHVNKFSDIKPGFINTKLTAQFNKNFLWVNPDYAAKTICKHLGNNKESFYVPGFWFFVVFILKFLPKNILRKL